MPILTSTYKPSFPFTNKHFNTVYRTFFSRISVDYKRERLELPDGDFMDLDVASVNSKTVIIALHGLEGSSSSKYMLALAKNANLQNIDCIAVNLRSCSGEPNRRYDSYHSGRSEDLEAIIHHVESTYDYDNITLVGYSLGGNITLKHLGESTPKSNKIKAAIAISVPCDLTGSSIALAKKENWIYMQRFLRSLKSKAQFKMKTYPEKGLNKSEILKAKSFSDFDNIYTAPAHGFQNAQDYWTKNSSKPFLKDIKIPTLMISALDDTFLSEECYPTAIAIDHNHLYLETPKNGGHVGFNSTFSSKNGYWLEKRILAFIKENSKI